MVDVPLPAAVTSPDALTAATASSLDSHKNSVPAMECPFASNASAASRTVSPRAPTLAISGVTATLLTVRATVTAALPEADPEVAVIVALPLAIAVTRPDEPTVATSVSLLDQTTWAPVITFSVLVAHLGLELHGRAQGGQHGGGGADGDRRGTGGFGLGRRPCRGVRRPRTP